MKKILLITILTLVIAALPLLLPSNKAEAHPVDVSFAIINVADDNLGKRLPLNEAYGYVSMNWVTAAGLLGFTENPDGAVEVLGEKEQFFNDYFAEKLQLSNNEKQCTLSSEMIPVEDFQLFYLNGLEFHVRFVCEDDLENVHIKNRILLDEFPNQTNVMSVYDHAGELLYSETLDSEKDELDIKVERETEQVEEAEEEQEETATDSAAPGGFTLYGNNFIANKLKSAGDRTMAGFASLLDSDNPWSRIGILLIVVVLGALHSFEGGHNKVILATMMMNNEVNLRGSMIYVFIFTLTHMSDIIILAVGLIIFNQYINLYAALPYVQQFSIVALLVLSLYITVKELIVLVKKKKSEGRVNEVVSDTDEISDLFKTDNEVELALESAKPHAKSRSKKPTTFKEQFMVAFVAGLAPCLTGWTIFILIVSSGYIWLLLPATVAFGIGVFIVLALFAFLVDRFKGKLLNRYSSFADYAPLASGILLLIVTLVSVV
ncbi:MAG: hypothetical protein QY318_04395 [Candidatus Dojkabacteria bacterium]|nr:MAG: hypothetical protein QY318_04395 [Candidatus Dojkabacteria bacterium]